MHFEKKPFVKVLLFFSAVSFSSSTFEDHCRQGSMTMTRLFLSKNNDVEKSLPITNWKHRNNLKLVACYLFVMIVSIMLKRKKK